MESAAVKIEKEAESECVSGDSATESKESGGGGTSCESRSSSDNSSSAQLGWPIRKAIKCSGKDSSQGKMKPRISVDGGCDGNLPKKQGSKVSETEMMKERFGKLLLGEDMSGSGKGVCPALTISNAITNLCATVFGQLWRLEPLSPEKKSMWKREMQWLLSVSDYIVELKPSWQTFADGSRLEVMTSRPRSDLVINLPALQKLDNMLLEILDGFTNTEFWYVDQGVIAPEKDGSGSFREAVQRQEDKWWLPVPRVPDGGLPELTTKQLTQKRDFASQILKAALSINSIALSDMEVPESYLETLPKNGRACLGDVIYRYITSDHFSSESLLDYLDVSSELVALEVANRVEAAIYVWRRRNHQKPQPNLTRSTTRSSWEIVKDLMIDGDKRGILAERADSLLHSLKLRFPSLTQTTLDTCKIQCNKDVGKSILESYSRVLESLAFNIVARIEDLLYVDDINKQPDKLSSMSLKKVTLPFSPFRSAHSTPSFSPAPLVSPAPGERTPFLRNKPPRRGLGVKRALTNYLHGDAKPKNGVHILHGLGSVSNRMNEGTTLSRLSIEGKEQVSVNAEPKGRQIDR